MVLPTGLGERVVGYFSAAYPVLVDAAVGLQGIHPKEGRFFRADGMFLLVASTLGIPVVFVLAVMDRDGHPHPFFAFIRTAKPPAIGFYASSGSIPLISTGVKSLGLRACSTQRVHGFQVLTGMFRIPPSLYEVAVLGSLDLLYEGPVAVRRGPLADIHGHRTDAKNLSPVGPRRWTGLPILIRPVQGAIRGLTTQLHVFSGPLAGRVDRLKSFHKGTNGARRRALEGLSAGAISFGGKNSLTGFHTVFPAATGASPRFLFTNRLIMGFDFRDLSWHCERASVRRFHPLSRAVEGLPLQITEIAQRRGDGKPIDFTLDDRLIPQEDCLLLGAPLSRRRIETREGG